MMKTVILCIGNSEGGDDGIGPYLAGRLQNTQAQDIVIDAGTTPENYTRVIKREAPDLLILVDAAEMNLPAGEIRRIPKEKISTMHLSTHGIPLSLLIQYLEKDLPHILFIGIQPKTMNGLLSDSVKRSGDHLIEILRKKQYDQITIL